MANIKEIRGYKQYYKDILYAKTRAEQAVDELYITDTFPVPEIKAPHKILRSGMGRKIVDSSGEQIISGNPQALVRALKGGDKDGIKDRMTTEANRWLYFLKKQNPSPVKSSIKNKLRRGESVIQLVHNQKWVVGTTKEIKENRLGLPVLFLVPDPMNVYCSPEEDDCGWFPYCGVPNRVVFFYERQLLDVITKYPSWGNPKKREGEQHQVEWFAYIDKNTHYAEADGETVIHKKNPYGFTNVIRKFSGFGSPVQDGDLSSLIVSDIKYSRDLIYEECAIRSDLASIIHLYTNTPKTLILPDGTQVNEEEIKEKYTHGAGEFNILTLPEGATFTNEDILIPQKEVFEHYYSIKDSLERRHPFIMSGYPLGSSGRQQDLSSISAMRRYDSVVDNTGSEWATAFQMAFEICNRIPTLTPDGIHKSDLSVPVEIEFDLKAVDPMEKSAKVTLGDKLWNQGNGSIDLETNHVEFQGRKLEDSKRIRAKMIADRLTLYNPNVEQIYAMIFAEEAELEEQLSKLQQLGQMGGGTGQNQTPTDVMRIKGEEETMRGMGENEMNLEKKPARVSPGMGM